MNAREAVVKIGCVVFALSLWERVRVRAGGSRKPPSFYFAVASPLTPTLSQRERELAAKRVLFDTPYLVTVKRVCFPTLQRLVTL